MSAIEARREEVDVRYNISRKWVSETGVFVASLFRWYLYVELARAIEVLSQRTGGSSYHIVFQINEQSEWSSGKADNSNGKSTVRTWCRPNRTHCELREPTCRY